MMTIQQELIFRILEHTASMKYVCAHSRIASVCSVSPSVLNSSWFFQHFIVRVMPNTNSRRIDTVNRILLVVLLLIIAVGGVFIALH